MDKYIFISYAHKDSEHVLPVIHALQQNGFRTWHDEGIDPGTEWDVDIARHIETCSYFIAFISKAYLESSNCKDEIYYARDLEKKRFLVYIEEVKLPGEMQMRLSRIQNISMHKYGDKNEFYRRLFDAEGIDVCRDSSFIEAVATKMPSTSPLQTPANPLSYPQKTSPWLITLVILLAIIILGGSCVLFMVPKAKTSSNPQLTGMPTPTESTQAPEPSESLEDTSIPVPTNEPENTPSPVPTNEPEITPSPIPTKKPDNPPSPAPAKKPENTAFTWKANSSGGVTITGLTETDMWDLIIPDTIDGKKVTAIGDNAFAECQNILRVIIPEGVVKIGDSAFLQCSNLAHVELPEGLIEIGETAFTYCDSLKSIELPDTLQTIKASALFMTGITNITIPASLQIIKPSVFALCNSLKAISVDEGNNNYCSVDGVLFDKAKKVLYCYPAGKLSEKYEIPYGIEIIEIAAFNGAKLKDVVFPDTVTTIKADAFVNCFNLSVLKLSKNVSSIAYLLNPNPIEVPKENPYYKTQGNFLLSKDGKILYAAFRSKTESTYSIPDGVEIISRLSFYNLENVTEIILPESVIEIEASAFWDCPKLKKLIIPASVIKLSEESFSGVNENTKIIVPAGSYAETFATIYNIPVQTE